MEGFDKIYLLRKNGTPKGNFGYSRNITFKDYFQKYSDELASIMPKSRVGAKTTLKHILQDEKEITTKELHNIRADINKKLFTQKNYYLEWLEVKKKEEMNTSSVPNENASINPKESSPLVLKIKNQKMNNSDAVGNKKSGKKSYVPLPVSKKISYGSRKYCQKRMNDKEGTSTREIEKKSKLIDETLPGPVEQSNVIDQTPGNKVDLFSLLSESISDDNRGSKKASNYTHPNFANKSIESEANLRNESSPLVLREEKPSTSKDINENESVIYSITVDSESEEETCIPSTSRGRYEYDSRDGAITAKQINDKNTLDMLKGHIKTYERRMYGKVVPKCKGKIYETQGKSTKISNSGLKISPPDKIKNQKMNNSDAVGNKKSGKKSYVPLPVSKKISYGSRKYCQKRMNDKEGTSTREIEKKSKLIDETLPGPVEQSNVIEQTPGNKVDLFSLLSESISDDNRGSKKASNYTHPNFADMSIEKETNLLDNCNETLIEKEHLRSPSEAIDIATQLVDTLILNIESIPSIESIDTANKAEFKAPEVPVRRGGRKRIPKKVFDYDERCLKKNQAEKEAKLAAAKARMEYKIPEYGDGESSSTRISSIIRGITNRKKTLRTKQTKRFRSARGTIPVNTTKKLGDKDLSPRKNFVVSFRVHKPFCQLPGKKNIRPARCQQEIEVLNFQTLDDLRLKISCESDYQYLSGDVSDWPYNPRTEVAKEKYKGAMFYIDNTFYINTEEGATDYSEVIRKWAEDRGINVGETKPMNSIKVEDLKLRMGYPYVYVHQGSCEHLVIISRARLLKKKSSLHSSDYPNLTKIAKSPVYYCITCTKTPARWIVQGSPLLPNDVNVMCDKCFHRYLYIGTTKIGNFKAYFFKQRALLFY